MTDTTITTDDDTESAEIEMRAIAFIERRDIRRLSVREKLIVGMAVSFTFNAVQALAYASNRAPLGDGPSPITAHPRAL
jgi:hypothetical protein